MKSTEHIAKRAPLIVTRRTVLATAGLSLLTGAAAGATTVWATGGSSADTAGGGNANGAPQGGGAGGANTMTFDYTGTYTGAIEADGTEVEAANESYSATDADQNAGLAQNGGTLTLDTVTLTKTGDDTDGDRCNFYGVNSILTAVGSESSAYVSACDLSATSEGSNGIFATDSANVLVNDTTIATAAGNSRGLDATYAGTIVAANMQIETQGDHCAGVATDRGGGNISVTDSTISTAGSGSPILYSTGDIEVCGITGTASGSQLAGMEGLNTILIKESELTSSITGKTASDPIADGVIIYQSTSGDAESTTGDVATFQAVDSTLSSAVEDGTMFYLTNTSASVVLKNTVLDFDSDSNALLTAQGNDANSWGQAGSNGATVTFTGIGQSMSGTVTADTISQVTVYLTEQTTWIGAASITENSAGSTQDSPLIVNIDATSAWIVSESCTVSELHIAEGATLADAQGKAVSIVAGGETVSGESSITVTVTGTYDTNVDTSAAGTLATDLIDRSAFDERFGTSTSFTL